jgi:hypothetical protein
MPGSDRRRRPLARVGASGGSGRLSDGVLVEIDGGYALSADGRQRLIRLEQTSDQPFADQHRQPKLVAWSWSRKACAP